MSVRFVIDESSWMNAMDRSEGLPDAVHELLERLDVASERREQVAKHPYIYEVEVAEGRQMYSMLFDPDCASPLERDEVMLLQLALDRATTLDDAELPSYEATIAGASRLAPAVAWAHAQRGQGRAVGVLPLALGQELQGDCVVVVAGIARQLHFVTAEKEHRAFFRDAIAVEDADEGHFQGLASSAFPTLGWVDGVWRGLGDFSKPYRDLRATIVVHLGVLDDHGAELFATWQSKDAGQIGKHLDARGAEASDENGRAKQNKAAERDRTRPYRGRDRVFWWHTKLQRHEDRIHFLHIPHAPPPHGHIVVGIFKNHCYLPD